MTVFNIIRFSSSSALVLWLLLITFFVLRDSAANTQQVVVGTMKLVANENGLAISGGNVLSTGQKFILNVLPKSSSAVRDKRLHGRKMLAYDVSTRRMMMTKEGLNGETSKISGKYNASMKSLGIAQSSMINNQNHRDKLKQTNSLPAGKGTLGIKPVQVLPKAYQHNFQDSKATLSCGSLKCSSRSKISETQLESNDPSQEMEIQKLLLAAKEIVDLMHMDYRTTGKPRSRPPINNYNPLSEGYLKP